MSLHPALVTFQRRLEAVGVVATPHGDHLCVRLPLLCAVRVRYDGARLTCEPRFATTSRNRATTVTGGGLGAAAAAFALLPAAAPLGLAAGALGALVVGYDLLGYVVTESAITRISLLWDRAHAGESPSAEAIARGTGTAPLHAPATAAGALPPPTPGRAEPRRASEVPAGRDVP